VNITKRRWRQAIGAVAIAGTAAVVLAGCTTTSSSSDDTSSTGGGTATIAQVNEVTSFNTNTPQGNLDINGMINQLTQPQFWDFANSDYKIEQNTDIGSYKKLSSDPLTVQYTLNKNAKWSDGKAMDSDDLLMGWAALSGYYDSATLDPATAEVTKGTQYFSTAQGDIYSTKFPKVNSDKSITITYNDPYVDWNLVNPIQFPAATIAKGAGISESKLVSTLKDTPAGDKDNPASPNADLQKIAKFWNTGFDASSLPSNKGLLVSGGPMKVDSWTPKQSMTLVKNPEYKGNHEVKISKLVIRFIGDANAQVTALQNGEVDAIQPQASADTVKALKAISGTNLLRGDQVAYDHLDLNFGSSVFKDENVRKAFLLTIPRQQILDSIVTPVNPSAKVLNSQIFLPGQTGYDDSVKNNGSSEYDKVDIDKAKQLLNGATPTVKILYNSKNPNRVDSFQAIQASAAKAGFKVTDGGSPDWGTLLPGGDYDASIFGWVNPGAGNAQIPQLFQIGNGSNYNKFSNADADKLSAETQTTLDTSKLVDQKEQIDKIAFQQAYGLPLFQSPGIFAVNKSLKGVKYFGGQTGLVWNIWDWSK
jgi:peptide/nickel transport system substrate-binding protein